MYPRIRVRKGSSDLKIVKIDGRIYVINKKK